MGESHMGWLRDDLRRPRGGGPCTGQAGKGTNNRLEVHGQVQRGKNEI